MKRLLLALLLLGVVGCGDAQRQQAARISSCLARCAAPCMMDCAACFKRSPTRNDSR
jgi:hypothetical protein